MATTTSTTTYLTNGESIIVTGNQEAIRTTPPGTTTGKTTGKGTLNDGSSYTVNPDGSVTIVMGNGAQTVVDYTNGGDTISANNGGDSITDSRGAGSGTDTFVGGNGKDALTDSGTAAAGSYSDVFFGANGADTLKAGNGNDVLIGGLGGDWLVTGTGRTTFVYVTNVTNNQASDSPYSAGAPVTPGPNAAWDVISGFRSGTDVLDFATTRTSVASTSIGGQSLASAAATHAGWPGAFVWIGASGTDGDAGVANGARAFAVWQDAGHNFIYADLDGDGKADLKIQVNATLHVRDVNGAKLGAPGVSLLHDTGSSNMDKYTSDGTLAASGVASDATVQYSTDGGLTWSSSFNPTEGVNNVQVRQTDGTTTSSPTSFQFTLDTKITAPTLALVNDTGTAGDNYTSDGSLSVSAPTETGTRTYTVDGQAAAGPSVSGDGQHTVTVTDTDKAGNIASASITFTLDTHVAAPTVSLTTDSGAAGDNYTNAAGVTVSSPSEAVSRSYSVDGGAASASYTAPTTDGNHTVTVTDTDKAGNSASGSLAFTLDTHVNTPTIALANDTGAAGDNYTSDGTLNISAATEAGTRTYTVDGQAATSPTVTGDGPHTVTVTDTDKAGNTASASITFTLDTQVAAPTVSLTTDSGAAGDNYTNAAGITVSSPSEAVSRSYSVDGGAASASYTAPTTDGGHTVTVTDTDKAGNTASGSLSFTLDTTVDTPTIALANDTGAAGDNYTSDGSLNISAPTEPGTRTYTVDGQAAAGPSVSGDGPHTVTVTDTDKAGNTASASITFTLDTRIDTPTIALANDTGAGGDNYTSDGSLNISAATEAGTRTYTVDGQAAAGPSVSGDGPHTVTVTDTDKAGNTASASISFTLDTRIDTPTIALANDTGAGGDNYTSDGSLNISAATEAGTRTYTVDGQAAASPSVNGDGPHTVTVTDTDKAGNTASASISFTLDTTIAKPTVTLTNDTDQPGDKLTEDPAITVSAPQEAVTRMYSVDGGAASASYTAPTTDGSHTVAVTDTDAAGNSATGSLTFVLDVNDAPSVTSGGSGAVDENKPAGTLVYTATGTDPDTTAPFNKITWSLGGADAAAFSIDASGKVTSNGSANYEAKSSYSITVIATDGGGLTDSKAVTIGVNDVNEKPSVTSANSAAIDENNAAGALVYTATASDPDTTAPNNTITWTLGGADAGAFGIDPQSGKVTINGSADYETKSAYAITVTATDGGNPALSDTQAVTININNVNEPPKVSGPVTGTAIEDGASSTLNALANASDPDAGTVLSVVNVPASLPAGVSYDAASHSFTLDPSNAAYQHLAAGVQSAPVVVNYGVSDGTNTTAASMSWVVTGTNDKATIGGGLTGIVVEDSVLTATGQATISDPDDGQSYFGGHGIVDGTFGSFAFNDTTGVWTYALNNTATVVQNLNTGQSGVDSLSIWSGDGQTFSQIQVTIQGANEPNPFGPVTTFHVEQGNQNINGKVTMYGFDGNDIVQASNNLHYISGSGNDQTDGYHLKFDYNNDTNKSAIIEVVLMGYHSFNQATQLNALIGT